MSILIINNGGFLRNKGYLYVTKTTGQFISDVEQKTNERIELLQFVEEGILESGINDYKLPEQISVQTIDHFSGMKKIVSYIIAFFKILTIVNKNKFVYIFYPGHLPLMVALACIFSGRPFGLYVRGEYKKLSKLIFRKAKFINTVGIIFKTDIQKENANCYLIRPMVQFDFSKGMRIDQQLKENEFLFVGRIEKRKGIWEIINAAEKLMKLMPEYKFRLIGAGADLIEVKKYVEAKKLVNVIITGAIFNSEQLMQYYLSAKLFIFPSHNEGFPRVLYEAMYFKLPIITTFVGNIPGIMEDGENCLKIESKSSESIIINIGKLVNNNLLMDKLIMNGSETLKLIFSPKVISHVELFNAQYKRHAS